MIPISFLFFQAAESSAEVPTPPALKDTDGMAGNEEIDTTSDCSATQNVQPLAPPPMPPMLNFLDSEFNFNPTPMQSRNQDDCNVTTGNAIVEMTGKVKRLIQYSDSDDADDCPVFEYSVESMEVATESEQPKEATQAAEAVAASNSKQVDNLLPADRMERI